MSVEDRRHFRIKYPDDFRPELIIDGQIYALEDVSESGLRFSTDAEYRPKVGDAIVTTLGFRSGHRLTIKGRVVKTLDSFIMLELTDYIPKNVLKEEADILLQQIGEVPTDIY